MPRVAPLPAALALALVGCAGSPAPPAPAAATSGPVAAPSTAANAAAKPPPPASETVVVRATSSASRQPEEPRRLRALLAATGGRIELPRSYQRVSLIVEKVVEGSLDDPDYAKRPVGVNHLPVVLLDEAAFAASDGLDGFVGTWRLTKLADGTLVVRTIEGTPFSPSLVVERQKVLATTRAQLHAELPDDRIAALETLEKHFFYELVPDVLALLDDARVETRPPVVQDHDILRLPRVVRDVADARLRQMFRPMRDAALPKERARTAWAAYWENATTRKPPALAPVIGGSAIELMRVAANQTWPEIAVAGKGKLALGVARLETPVDAHRAGIALVRAAASPRTTPPLTWVAGTTDAGFEPQGLTAARGPLGALLFVGARDAWQLAILDDATKAPLTISPLEGASHAALASDDKGFAVLSGARGAAGLTLTVADPKGKIVGSHAIATRGRPELDYHHGIRPLAIVARPAGGWYTAVETDQGIAVTVVDAAFAVISNTNVPSPGGTFEPVLAAGPDGFILAMRVGHEGGEERLATSVLDPKSLAAKTTDVGVGVQRTSGVVTLAAGFAIAWIEADSEVHVGRWDGRGRLLGQAVAHRGEVAPFTLALYEEDGALVVAYEDTARYPYALVARRVPLDALR